MTRGSMTWPTKCPTTWDKRLGSSPRAFIVDLARAWTASASYLALFVRDVSCVTRSAMNGSAWTILYLFRADPDTEPDSASGGSLLSSSSLFGTPASLKLSPTSSSYSSETSNSSWAQRAIYFIPCYAQNLIANWRTQRSKYSNLRVGLTFSRQILSLHGESSHQNLAGSSYNGI